MKKNLALILVLVMVVTSLLSVVPMAEASSGSAAEKYLPQITYSNVNYTDKVYLMFAVPTTNTLAAPTNTKVDGTPSTNEETKVVTTVNTETTVEEAVVLLLWESKEDGSAFTVKDLNKLEIAAEAKKATIGGVEHYVFTYDGLDAGEMTKVICARPAIVKTTTVKTTTITSTPVEGGEPKVETKEDTKVTKASLGYGALVEYSVLEYAVAAKGGFDGIAGLTNTDALALIDAMLNFGAFVQSFVNGEEAEFYANSEVAKIYVTPVISGQKGDKIFAGFKSKAAGTVTLDAPYIDGYDFVGYADAQGKAIVDLDGIVQNGVQVEAAEGDLEIIANYDAKVMYKADPTVNAANSSCNIIDTGTGNKYNLGIGGFGFNAGTKGDNYSYAALDVIDDPYKPGEKTYRVTGNTQYSLGLGESTNDWKVSMKPSAVEGWGDIIDASVVVDFTIGRGPDGNIQRTGNLRLRSNQNKHLTNLLYIDKDGTVKFYNSADGTSTIDLPVKVAETGYTRYVIVVDFENEVIKAYAAANADGELVFQAETKTPFVAGNHASAATWMDWAKTLDRIEWMGGAAYNNFTDEQKAALADLDGDGKGDSLMVQDGVQNVAAVKYWHNYYNSILIKSFSTYVGNPFK